MNVGGRPKQDLPPDPARARKILRDRERRASQRAQWGDGSRPTPIFIALARKAWR